MKLENLKPAKGSNKKERRIARGEGSGSGDTAGRGHKGDKARAGHKEKRAHEGGQMPLQMRLPKRGFKNFTRVEYLPINLSTLQHVADKHGVTEINFETLLKAGIISKTDKYKVLGRGELTAKLNVSAHAFSATAKSAIEGKGGAANVMA